jgi:hypothetical protein
MSFINWLVTSSADPNSYSLTFKGAAMLAVPWILQALNVVCGLAIVCFAVDQNVLTSAIDTVANIIYLVFTLVGSAAFLFGLGRKIWLGRWSAPTPPANLPTA